MKRGLVWLALALPGIGVWASGCSDSNDAPPSETPDAAADANADTGTVPLDDAGSSDAGEDASTRACAPPSGLPERLLLSINNMASSELVVFDVASKTVAGRLTYPSMLGLTMAVGADPYLMESATDVVAKLDANEPWKVLSTWNVAGDDKIDGGKSYANPAAVVVPTCENGYVVRYNRNKLAVLDTTKIADAGSPETFIDLASLVQPNDKDGFVNMTSAVYVPKHHRLYVLLGNNDLTKVATDGYTALCTDTKPSIVGIDVDKGEIVSLGGQGPSGSILLEGYGPPVGIQMAYDAATDRLVVLSGGCNVDDSGNAGPIARRRIESVALATGEVTTLLSLDDVSDYPAAFAYLDGTHAAVGFFGKAYFWDPSKTTLGAEIPGGLQYFAFDKDKNLIGLRQVSASDGGRPYEIASVPFSASSVDAGAIEVLGEQPFTDNSGFVSGVEVWPHP